MIEGLDSMPGNSGRRWHGSSSTSAGFGNAGVGAGGGAAIVMEPIQFHSVHRKDTVFVENNTVALTKSPTLLFSSRPIHVREVVRDKQTNRKLLIVFLLQFLRLFKSITVLR